MQERSIRVGAALPAPIVTRPRQAVQTPAKRVHYVGKGQTPALVPPPAYGPDRRLPGGLRPVAYRSSNLRWDEASCRRDKDGLPSIINDPFACKAIKGEHMAARAAVEGTPKD